jgi:hypothetical protein
MNAAETIAAAIEKLGTAESNVMHERGCGYVPLTNDPLIVTLHRTIDAQLAILQAFQQEATDVDLDADALYSDGHHMAGTRVVKQTPLGRTALDLARAILGDTA